MAPRDLGPPSPIEWSKTIHDQVYPSRAPQHNYQNLSVAAAFEGMHHWEHEQRHGSGKGRPMSRGEAKASMARVVAEEAGKLYDKAYRRDPADPEKRERMIDFATNHAMELYDWQYGDDDDVYDDYHDEYNPRVMPVNRTMREEWREHH